MRFYDEVFGDLPAPTSLPASKRPKWLKEEGLVMSGNWEPLIFISLLNRKSIEPNEEERRLYEAQMDPKMFDMLKELGVNFIMGISHKGFGMVAEKESMEDAKKVAAICREKGLHFGSYAFSGTIFQELFRKEVPESVDWELLDADGNPLNYFDGQSWRHHMNRLHPDAEKYLERLLEYEINEMGTELIHLDNYSYGPGYDPVSIKLFREYLAKHYLPADIGVESFDNVVPPKGLYDCYWRHHPSQLESTEDGQPPKVKPVTTALERAWINFQCYGLAESYRVIADYARSLKPDILMECNVNNFGSHTECPMDDARVCRYGEALWDENIHPEYKDGKLVTRQIAYKTAQILDNIVFAYIRTKIDAAETLAYNTDCYGNLMQYWATNDPDPWAKCMEHLTDGLKKYVKFFHAKRPYTKYIDRISDVAILRSFPSQCFIGERSWSVTNAFENAIIQGRIPWMLIFDQHIADLTPYRALCLAGADALTDPQIARIRKYAQSGGGLVLTEESGWYDEETQKRESDPFADLKGEKIIRLKSDATPEAIVAALKKACGGSFSMSADVPNHITIELTEQKKEQRRLAHLVNYAPEIPVKNSPVEVAVPEGWKIKQVLCMSPESDKTENLPFTQEGNRIKTTVPLVEGYALLSVETR